jgi:hypothetical protein
MGTEITEGKELAPQSGHISNFCGPVSPLIEPLVAHCFECDPCELLADVHDRHPVWTRLELAKGAQGNFRIPGNP